MPSVCINAVLIEALVGAKRAARLSLPPAARPCVHQRLGRGVLDLDGASLASDPNAYIGPLADANTAIADSIVLDGTHERDRYWFDAADRDSIPDAWQQFSLLIDAQVVRETTGGNEHWRTT